MTTIFIVVLLIVVVLLSYALWGRAWLVKQPWAQGFFAWIEPIETALFKKSETILVGRLTWLGGLIVTAYDTVAVFVTSLDLTPITTRITASIPPDLRPLAISSFVFALGLVISWLRKRTSKPLEIVALPINSPPEVAIPAEQAVAANAQAVATIQAAKAAGAV